MHINVAFANDLCSDGELTSLENVTSSKIEGSVKDEVVIGKVAQQLYSAISYSPFFNGQIAYLEGKSRTVRDFSLNGGYSLKSFFKMAPPDAAGVVESTTFYNALSMTNATPLEISSATLWYSVAASFIIATVAYGIVSKRLYNLMEEQNKNKEIAKRIFVGKADKERAENGDQRMFKIHWVERFVPSFLANSVFGNPMELLDTFVVAHVRATFTDSLKAFVNQVVAIDPQKQLRWDKMPRRSRRSLVGLQKTQTAKLGQDIAIDYGKHDLSKKDVNTYRSKYLKNG